MRNEYQILFIMHSLYILHYNNTFKVLDDLFGLEDMIKDSSKQRQDRDNDGPLYPPRFTPNPSVEPDLAVNITAKCATPSSPCRDVVVEANLVLTFFISTGLYFIFIRISTLLYITFSKK